MDVLSQIMGVEEAGQVWGLSSQQVKRLCRDGKVKSVKIGKTWIIDKNQNNPKRRDRMNEETYTVTARDQKVGYDAKSHNTKNKQEAIRCAENWAKEHGFVFIEYHRESDGQQGYLNPDGYDITGENWAE